jgi:hypothetical protein
MLSFQAMFLESRGKPIEYQGRTLVMSDFFPTDGRNSLRFTFEACDCEWRQGAALKCDGIFRCDGKTFDGKTGLVFWRDTAPQVVDFEVDASVETVRVYNVWDVGDGVTHARHNCAAMIVEQLPSGRRYRCNDGFPDDDFNDVVFSLECVEST